MKNKKTVLIFANDTTGSFAVAIKERLSANKDILCIIIGENEFRSTGKQIAQDLLLKPNGIVNRTSEMLLQRRQERSIDKLPPQDIAYKEHNVSYQKMNNVFTRYSPRLVIMTGGTLLQEVLAVRAAFWADTKVFMLVKDFAIHSGIINKHLDKYYVENTAVLTMLANKGVKEGSIALSNIQVPRHFDTEIDKTEALQKLGLDTGKPTVAFCLFGKSTDKDKTAINELAEFKKRCNIVAYCAEDRELLGYAAGLGITAYNEGGDLNLIYSAADIAVTRPQSKTITEALYKKVLCAAITPASELEQRSLKGLKGLIIDASAKGGLVTFLDDYLRTPDYRKSYSSITEAAAARLVSPTAAAIIDVILSVLKESSIN